MNTTAYLLGIDNGNTVSKAALFDLAGHEIAVASRPAETTYPHPGWTERSMDSLWASTAEAIRAVVAESGVDPSAIRAVGVTAHGNGLYLIDKHGHPVRPGIQSLDTRAAGILEARAAQNGLARAFPSILQEFWPAQPNALLPWLKQNEPESYARIDKIFLCKDYVKYRLTGEATSDYTDMSGTCLLDNRNRRYSTHLLDIYGIPEMADALPRLAESTEVIGHVTAKAATETGLAKGTPVVGGLFDVDAGALGAGVIDTGTLCMIAGTWSINEVLIDAPVENPALAMVSVAAIPGKWLVLEASATSTTNLEWFIDQCCGDERAEAARRGISVYQLINELVAGLPAGASEIIFHPFLFGSNVQPSARAGFYGVAGWHTKAHLLRALYEGVVFSHLTHVNKLRALGEPERARLTGGGSRSSVWTQIFADAINLPIEVAEGAEVSARGAAMAAGIGVGLYADFADAVAQAVRIERVQAPIPANTPYYLERFAAYSQITKAMQAAWDSLATLRRPPPGAMP
jgi:L-xylulokinase